MKNNVNSSDLLILMYWVKTFCLLEKRNFEYDYLLKNVNTHVYSNKPIDINVYHIDDVMVEAYKIYKRIKDTELIIDDVLSNNKFDITKESMLEELNKFKSVFEDLIENYKYQSAEIRGIQNGLLTEKMMSYVEVEEYEMAAKIRDMINNI